MKRYVVLFMTCIVLDQLKGSDGWITDCKGIEVDGQVIFPNPIRKGDIVQYKPYIVEGQEMIYGRVIEIIDPRKSAADGAGKPAE